jgi:hypothetical protein
MTHLGANSSRRTICYREDSRLAGPETNSHGELCA